MLGFIHRNMDAQRWKNFGNHTVPAVHLTAGEMETQRKEKFAQKQLEVWWLNLLSSFTLPCSLEGCASVSLQLCLTHTGTHARTWHPPTLSELLISTLTLQPLIPPSDIRRSRRSVLAAIPLMS